MTEWDSVNDGIHAEWDSCTCKSRADGNTCKSHAMFSFYLVGMIIASIHVGTVIA